MFNSVNRHISRCNFVCVALDLLDALVRVFFSRQETCDNDDDFTVGWRNELPPGVQGCLRPQSPDNSFLRVNTLKTEQVDAQEGSYSEPL